jgi:hypothetical protein
MPLAPRTTSSAPAQVYAAIFQYVGSTGLTVIGPATGRMYRFSGPGSKERVELQDRAGLLRVPQLREIT